MVETEPSYNKFLSPPSEQRLPVLTSVRLHGLSRLEPVLASYQAEFTVSLRWRDSRLQFDNLRAESSMNSIRPEETDQIWFPSFYFDNTRDKVRSLTDSKAVLRVLRQGEGQLSSKQDTENKLIFQGRENFIQYERFYSEQFECDYFLHWYPFDYQTCYIDIKPSSGVADFIKLVPDEFEYDGPLDLTEYNVKKTEIRIENDTMLRVEVGVEKVWTQLR